MTATALPAPPATRRAGRGQQIWQAARWVTLALVLATMAATLLLGQRHSSWEQLTAALDEGRVQQVQVENAMGGPDGISSGTQGSSTVRIVWRDRLVTRYTEVHQVVADHSADTTDAGTSDPGDGLHRIDGRIDTALQSVQPAIRIDWLERRSASWTSFAGNELEVGAWILLIVPLWFMPLYLLVTGPEPRHLTRWAWAWLMLVTTWLGAAAYLTWGARGALPGRRRLTGGWTLLLAVVLASLT